MFGRFLKALRDLIKENPISDTYEYAILPGEPEEFAIKNLALKNLRSIILSILYFKR